MLPLPARFAGIILAFAPLFVHRTWRHAQTLLIGAILTPGRRTVTSLLRITGRGWVLIRDPERRFAPQALLCTDLVRDPAQIVAWFVRRWCVEVTFQEARAHLGVETQRQWSDKAIARTTPCLLALFSIVTLLVARLAARERRSVTITAWYRKPEPTFSNALATVRRAIWCEQPLLTSPRRGDRTRRRLPPEPWAYALCHAA